jgi:hypothetical protein
MRPLSGPVSLVTRGALLLGLGLAMPALVRCSASDSSAARTAGTGGGMGAGGATLAGGSGGAAGANGGGTSAGGGNGGAGGSTDSGGSGGATGGNGGYTSVAGSGGGGGGSGGGGGGSGGGSGAAGSGGSTVPPVGTVTPPGPVTFPTPGPEQNGAVQLGKGSYAVSGSFAVPSATPSVTSDFSQKPISAKWWVTLITENFSENMFAHPLGYKATASGLDMAYPGWPGGDANGFHAGVNRDVTVGISGMTATAAQVARYSDFSVTARW